MKANIRKNGDSALSELARTYEMLRDELAARAGDLARRLDDLDVQALGGRAYASARDLRQRVEERVRPRPRRSRPRAWVALGLVTLGVAWLTFDRRRRDQVQHRLAQLGSRAQSGAGAVSKAVDSVMRRRSGGVTELDEARLRSAVEAAFAGAAGGEGGGRPEGLQVAVEGRTVYLRGTVEPALADRAAERAQAVPGVAAVVNLTTPPQPAGGGRVNSQRAGNA